MSGFSAFMPHGDEDDCCLENVVEEWEKSCENPDCTGSALKMCNNELCTPSLSPEFTHH